MSMMEYFEAGYKVVAGSMWGDCVMSNANQVECYADDAELKWVDEEAKIAYFYDCSPDEDEEWEE